MLSATIDTITPPALVVADPSRLDFTLFVKAVGRGQKLRRDLTAAEARTAMRLILRREATPAQMGGFLIGQRVKGEAEVEIRGFTQVVRDEFLHRTSPRVADLLDLGLPYDGKVKTAQLAPAVAIVLATVGVPVVLHGDEGVPTKQGVTPGAVLKALSVPVDLEPAVACRMIESIGLGYLSAERYAPAWHALIPLRCELGLRTALNTIEKLFNPADAPYQISGFFHGEYLERLRLTQTGTRASWIVQGEEGSIEMAAGRATHVFAANAVNDVVLDPISLGLPVRERLTPPFAVEAHARLNAEALNGEPGSATDQVALTAGTILKLLGAAASVVAGVARVRQAIESHAPQHLLMRARNFR